MPVNKTLVTPKLRTEPLNYSRHERFDDDGFQFLPCGAMGPPEPSPSRTACRSRSAPTSPLTHGTSVKKTRSLHSLGPHVAAHGPPR